MAVKKNWLSGPSQRAVWWWTAIIALIQIGVLIGDLILAPHDPRLPLLPLVEALAPYLGLPLFKRFLGPRLHQMVLDSPSLQVAVAFLYRLGAVTVLVLLAFQLLDWYRQASFHGGIFYLGGLYLMCLHGLMVPKSRDIRQGHAGRQTKEIHDE